MYKIFDACLTIIWVMDILDFPFMEFLDTDIPMNFLGWLLVILFIPGTSTVVRYKKEAETDEDKSKRTFCRPDHKGDAGSRTSL